jgi:hypothetical protein
VTINGYDHRAPKSAALLGSYIDDRDSNSAAAGRTSRTAAATEARRRAKTGRLLAVVLGELESRT